MHACIGNVARSKCYNLPCNCNKGVVCQQFLIELSLIDVEPFIKYLPSVTAAAAICLANFTLGHEVWVSGCV